MGQVSVTIAMTDVYQSYAVNIPVTALTGDVYIGFEDAWAEGGFTPRLFPAAQDETDPQVRSWIIAGAGGTPDINNLGNNATLATIDSFGLPGNWMIRANANTADRFCTAQINGHLTWQGITQPDPRNPLMTGTLSLCVNGLTYNYPNIHTDNSGNFSLTVGVPDGTYNWQMKGAKHISTAGTLTVVGGSVSQEFGLQKTGNTNADNVVGSTDFNTVKTNFGQSGDRSSDFNMDNVTGSTDFNLLKGNFGQAGVVMTCP